MKGLAIFVVGALAGALALALGLLWLGWPLAMPSRPVADVQAPVAEGVDRDGAAKVDLPSTVPPRAAVPLPAPATPYPDVPTTAPTAPTPGPLPEPLPQDPAAASPALIVPVAGILPTQLADTFTDARGEGRLHDAIDIMAPTGTPVLAVADGRIVKLFTSVPGGLTLYQFDGKDEYAYYYAHLDRYADGVVEGQAVKQGDLVGYVGYTGNANPAAPHLHFAIFVLGPEKNWWQGTAINPYPSLGGR